MTKEEFNKLTILKQLEYINSLLDKGKSLRGIGEELKMSKTTFRDRFLTIGYTRDEDINQYTKDNKIVIQSHQEGTKRPQKANKQVTEGIKISSTKELQKNDNYDKDILELINNKNELLTMLDNYKNSNKIIDTPQLNISSLPQEIKKDIINKSIKVYKTVYKNFDEVCNQYVSIKKQDMISLALYEFYEKYKKYKK